MTQPNRRERILVTGGYGFIGSGFVRTILKEGHKPLIVDAETYAADKRRVADVASEIDAVIADVADPEVVDVVSTLKPDVIVHFAAATHVTRSETDEGTFFRTNVEGTRTLLRSAELAKPRLFVHVSTDEVYGPCPDDPFREDDKEPGEGRATSAYARSKALADDLAVDAMTDVPVVVVRLTNCYGPWQHPEKAIPRWTIRALEGSPVPVWGDGGQIRQWMHLEDACAALLTVCERSDPGAIYNIAPPTSELRNLEVATAVAVAAGQDASLIRLTAYDRPQHDRRYAIDASKIAALGWEPKISLEDGLRTTADWYRDNRWWWESLVPDAESLYEDIPSSS